MKMYTKLKYIKDASSYYKTSNIYYARDKIRIEYLAINTFTTIAQDLDIKFNS